MQLVTDEELLWVIKGLTECLLFDADSFKDPPLTLLPRAYASRRESLGTPPSALAGPPSHYHPKTRQGLQPSALPRKPTRRY